VGVRDQDHVRFLDLLEAADAGAIEANAVHPDGGLRVIEVEFSWRDGEVLPEAGKVVELEVDHLDVVLLDELRYLLSGV
jgi:hypothetical protein